MIHLRNFWRRNRNKVLVSAGIVGSGYFLYKLYDTYKQKLADLETELARERENDDLLKAHMQENFETIQSIANATTLPRKMQNLADRIAEELDLTLLTERLMKGKDQPNTLTVAEKLELWEQLKVLSFTRMVLSLWAMALLSLYIRVQVNILGRHLYDTACGIRSAQLPEDDDLIDREDQVKFVDSADFLSNHGLPALITNIHTAATEALKGKQLMDTFNNTTLRETIMQILDTFMSIESPHYWVQYLMPPNCGSVNTTSASEPVIPETSKFDQLMTETRMVISSEEFGIVVDVALRKVVDGLVEEIEVQDGGNGLISGVPLAKLIARVAQMGPQLLVEPDKNRFIQVIRSTAQVEVFFTLLYSTLPTS